MATEPITVAEAARHLGVASDDPGYADLSVVITAARQYVEQFLDASVVVQERVLTLDSFGSGGAICLPNGPVLSITSVQYVDSDGATQTLSSALYQLTNYPFVDYLTPAYGTSWPTTRSVPGAVTITYQAGMMTGSPLTLPYEDIRSAIKLVLGDLWALRETQVLGTIISVSKTAENLLHFYRRGLGV